MRNAHFEALSIDVKLSSRQGYCDSGFVSSVQKEIARLSEIYNTGDRLLIGHAIMSLSGRSAGSAAIISQPESCMFPVDFGRWCCKGKKVYVFYEDTGNAAQNLKRRAGVEISALRELGREDVLDRYLGENGHLIGYQSRIGYFPGRIPKLSREEKAGMVISIALARNKLKSVGYSE